VLKKVMISAGEASGELYGAMLSREIKKLWPDVQIFGIGGPRMEEEGVSLIAPISHVIGILEAARHLVEIKKIFNRARDALLNERPDILVLIDYPDFNITLAQKARSAGIPVLYYVSPQVWAWRTGRIKRIASLVNKIAVLFPFETDYYKDTGLPCEFVGHPVVETINIRQTKKELKESLGLDPQKGVIALLPGSRPGEINRHEQIVAELARRINSELPDMQIAVPLVPGTSFTNAPPDHAKIIYGKTTEIVACSEAAAVASGTATFQTALLGIPMVVFYKVSFLTFHLVKFLAKIKYVSLVNLLSDKEVVKELLQSNATPDRIFPELKKIIKDLPYRNEMISSLDNIKKMMQDKRPSARVALIVGEIAGWSAAE
jgi:lipid-A-disaccharide synthase